MQRLEVVRGHSEFLSHFSIPQANPTQPVKYSRWLGQGDFCEKTRPESFSDWRHSEFMVIMHRSVVTSVQTLHKRYLLAVAKPRIHASSMLLDRGANVHVADDNGFPPLHIAVATVRKAGQDIEGSDAAHSELEMNHLV